MSDVTIETRGETEVHETALVDPAAELGQGVTIGPWALIGPRVQIGDGVEVGPRVLIERDSPMVDNLCLAINAFNWVKPLDGDGIERAFRELEKAGLR